MSKRISIVCMVLLLGVTGCQSTPESDPDVISAQQNAFKKAFDQLQVENERWQQKLKTTDELEIYAPENYQEMLSTWRDAQDIYLDIVDAPNKILKSYSIFSSQSYLEAYQDRIATVEHNYKAIHKLKLKADVLLKESIDQVAYLDKIETQTEFKKQYDNVIKYYRQLFTYVMFNELDKLAKEQSGFLKQAKELEVKVMKKKFVTPLQDQLMALQRQDAKSQASVCFNHADSSVLTTVNVIAAYPRDLALIKKSVAASQFSLDRTRIINNEVTHLKDLSSRQYENAILRHESQLYRISQALDNSDHRNKTIEKQTSLIVHAINEWHSKDKSQQLTQQLHRLKAENQQLQVKIEQYQHASSVKVVQQTESDNSENEQEL